MTTSTWYIAVYDHGTRQNVAAKQAGSKSEAESFRLIWRDGDIETHAVEVTTEEHRCYFDSLPTPLEYAYEIEQTN